MDKILGGLVLVNGTDIWKEYGVFLVEDKRGGMDTLTAILTPSKTKKDTAVSIREEQGEKYSATLTCKLMNYGKYKFEQSKREKRAEGHHAQLRPV